MSDQFDWWRSALKGQTGEIHDGHPQSGYFKMRRTKDGPWLPVAIWSTADGQYCCVGKSDQEADAHEIWTWCAKHPVPKDAAKHAFEHGSWPGDVPGIGDNSGVLSIEEEINDAVSSALSWLSKTRIADKATLDTAANWRARLLDLGKRADAQLEIEKRPHDAASKAVQAKWKPVVDCATDAANKLRDALTVYMRAEQVKLQAEADAKRKAAEDEARKQREQAESKNLPMPVDVPLTFDDPVKVQAGGQRGRKTGLRTITRYVVTDYAAALHALKDHPEVRAAVEKVASAQAKAGAIIPGVEAKQEMIAA